MFVVLYRWRLKEGSAEDFALAWSEVTKFYKKHFDSLGSRLHLGSDGVWYGYAQWKSAGQRRRAFEERDEKLDDPALAAARDRMARAVEESLPEIELDIKADYLKSN